jgi:hypothetical protein
MNLTTLPADYYDLSFLDKINYSDDDDDDDKNTGTFNNNNNNDCVKNKDQHSNAICARKKHYKKKSDDDSDDEDYEDNSTNNYIVLNTNCKNNNSNEIYDRACNNLNQLLFNNTEIIANNHSTSDDVNIQWSHLMIMPVDIEKDTKNDCCCPLQLNNVFHNDVELFCAIQLHLFEQWCKKMNRILPHSILSCLFYRCFYIVIVSQDYYYNDQQISSPSTISSISDDKYALARIIPYYLASIMHLSPSWICSCRDIITVLHGRITLHEEIYSSLHIPMDHHYHHHHYHHHDSVGNTNTTTNSTTTNTIPCDVLHNHNLSYLEVVFNTILILVQRYQKNISFNSYYHHHPQQQQPQQQLSAHDSTVAMSQLCDLFTLLCIFFCDDSIQSHFYSIISYTIQLLLDILFEIQWNDQLYYQQQHLSGQQLQSLSNDHGTIDSDRVPTSSIGVSEGNIIIPLQLKRSMVKLSKFSGK